MVNSSIRFRSILESKLLKYGFVAILLNSGRVCVLKESKTKHTVFWFFILSINSAVKTSMVTATKFSFEEVSVDLKYSSPQNKGKLNLWFLWDN